MLKYYNYFSLFLCFSSCENQKRFELLKPETSGVKFRNQITIKDTANILDTEFIYNGGGIATGDLNGDGFEDLYFTGNQVENKLYLNKGKMTFEDVTSISKAQKNNNQWSAGVTILDINNDGKKDIYVCNTLSANPKQAQNLLFINKGNNQQNIPVFEEMSKKYGLECTKQTSFASFADFDLDGDLDCFLGVNFIDQQYPNQYMTRLANGDDPNTDVLMENVGSDSLGHPFYKDISKQAGILLGGYSHSGIFADFNEDGYPDIYVANDYVGNDLLYINNKDAKGSTPRFTNQIKNIFKHQSFSAMGSDMADFDNDGKPDLFTSEMQPVSNKRKKLFNPANNYSNYLFTEQYGYEYEYVRNTLQWNQGINPSTNLPQFSEIGLLAGVHQTDWSWAPLFADFDNDGYKDLLVTNGYPKDISDKDFGAFRKSINSATTTKQELYNMIPERKIANLIFKNSGNLTFSNEAENWGLNIPSFSNGAAYADLDKDGDLDIVINNINDMAFIYQNNTIQPKKEAVKTNFVRFEMDKVVSEAKIESTKISIYFENGKSQNSTLLSGRGYLSGSEKIFHFGLGSISKIDSAIIAWPNNKNQKLENCILNKTNVIKYQPNRSNYAVKTSTIFELINGKDISLDYFNEENDFIDYNFQKTLPHKFSQYGPAISVGDLNGDKLDDIILAGSSRMPTQSFLQTNSGKFVRKEIIGIKVDEKMKEEDSALLLFDVDNDGDNDLYIGRGSGQHEPNSALYEDVLLVNDGKGNFRKSQIKLPIENINTSTVKAADYDLDGDLDLFIGSRVLPRNYPQADFSYILSNESKTKDNPVFKDVTNKICPEMFKIGLVSDAIWTDFNNDNKPDLILACEWSPLLLFENKGNKFENISKTSGLYEYRGWWNSICPADFDNDGDMDYVVGNYGDNSYFKPTNAEPLNIYAKDFDNNGSYDPFIALYWPNNYNENEEYFYHTRDDMVKQCTMIRNKFQTYGEFGEANVNKVFDKKEMEGVLKKSANYFKTSIVENLGNNKFVLKSLPIQAQIAPVFGILAKDLNDDNLLDLILVGNDYGFELLQGRSDALNGLTLLNIGKNNFNAVSNTNSGFWVTNDAKNLVNVNIKNVSYILATQNKGNMLIFKQKNIANPLFIAQNETSSMTTYKNGQKRKSEFYFGNTFGSQSARSLDILSEIKTIEIKNTQGKLRKITQ